MRLATATCARHAVIAIVSTCVVGLGHARADADAGTVVVGGGAEDHDRRVVAAAVAAAARQAGWALPREPLAKQDADRLLDCGEPARPWACVPASLGGQGIRRIFVFAVDRKQADNGAPLVVLTAKLIVAAPQALVVRQRFCEHCADDRLTEASAELARQLLQDLAVRAGRTILDVSSTPTGARITVDGQPIGATNATFNTSPGRHVVVIDKPGYRPETRAVVAEEGKTAAVAVVLTAGEPTQAAPPDGRVTSALVAGGTATLVGGGVLIELGRRGSADKYRYTGATPAGAVIGIAGAIAITAGIYRWWHGPAPAVGLTTGGVIAGWATAF